MKGVWKFGLMYRLIEDLRLLISLIKDYWSGRYRKLPYLSLVIILFAILYFLSPFDLVPDYLIGLGQIDDVIIISLCLFLLEKDLHKYKEWGLRSGS
jgi:uncharacterized membrane protein YkvA (DUF1232 family)